MLAQRQGFYSFRLRAQKHGIIREIVPALANQPDRQGRLATAGWSDDEEAESSFCNDSCGMEAIESQRPQELEQAKRPEITLQERGLGKKGGRR